ncbi:MAG: hypothetical protein ACIAXF_09475 [Phycisphaerales bacterium JB063]
MRYLLFIAIGLCCTACSSSPQVNVGQTVNTSAQGLTRAQAQAEADAAWDRYRQSDTARQLLAEYGQNAIVHGEDTMPIHAELWWDEGTPKPEAGYPVYISMHGGGAFTPGENEEQWEIQQERYPAVQGLYICPRSARDTWDHWHEQHMFRLIDRLVRAVLLRDDIDPDRIYLSGYCSGGNGVYQLGPVLADRWAAVSASKGIHEGSPLANLRNCPIDIQWGEDDPDTIDRPGLNRISVNELYALHDDDRGGYTFREIEHWRQGRFVNDKSTVGWLARFTRDTYPQRIVWEQNGDVRESSNPIQHQFYYLAVDPGKTFDGTGPDIIIAELDTPANTVSLEVTGYKTVWLRLNDAMLDLDQPVTVVCNGEVVFHGSVSRNAQTLAKTLAERGDRRYMFPVELEIEVVEADASGR